MGYSLDKTELLKCMLLKSYAPLLYSFFKTYSNIGQITVCLGRQTCTAGNGINIIRSPSLSATKVVCQPLTCYVTDVYPVTSCKSRKVHHKLDYIRAKPGRATVYSFLSTLHRLLCAIRH